MSDGSKCRHLKGDELCFTKEIPGRMEMKEKCDYRRELVSCNTAATRGLTQSHNRTLKYVFKSAALTASRCGPFKAWYAELVERGLRPELARVTIARRIAAITLAVWKSGEVFNAEKLIRPTA
jgi:hypothetical protein